MASLTRMVSLHDILSPEYSFLNDIIKQIRIRLLNGAEINEYKNKITPLYVLLCSYNYYLDNDNIIMFMLHNGANINNDILRRYCENSNATSYNVLLILQNGIKSLSKNDLYGIYEINTTSYEYMGGSYEEYNSNSDVLAELLLYIMSDHPKYNKLKLKHCTLNVPSKYTRLYMIAMMLRNTIAGPIILNEILDKVNTD
jgi:hypothetical protein